MTAISDTTPNTAADTQGSQETEATAKPLLTIQATSGFAAINLREVWHFRDLLWTLALRDVKLRYKQTSLGVAWVVIQPLIAAGIMSFVFGKVAKLPSDGVPYFIFAFTGQLSWTVFSNLLNRIAGGLVGNSNLISKVYFPRLVLPLLIVPTVLLDFAIALVMLVVMIVFNLHSVVIGWQLLLFPVWLGILLTMAVGIGLWAAALNVRYRDIGYILPVVLGFVMYASPVAYAVSQVPEKYLWIYYLNPLASIIEGFRWSLLGVTSQPALWAVGYSAGLAVAVLVAGAFMFKRMERQFADSI